MEHHYTSSILIKRLLREYIRPYSGKLIAAVLAMIVVAAATAANAWMMQPALDTIFLKHDRTMLMIIPVAVFLIAIIKGFGTYFQSLLMKYVGQRIITDMQLTLYEHLLYADMAMLHRQSSGKLISRFTNDITVMRRSVSNVLTGIAKELLTVVFLVGLMFYQSLTLSLIAFTVFPIAVYPIIRLGKRMRKISHRTQEELGNYTSQLDETFQGIRTVKAYGREPHEIGKARGIIEGIFALYIKAARTESGSSPIMEALSGIAIAAVIWYGGTQVINGTTTPGSFFSFITALIMAYKPVKNLADLNTSLQEGLASAKRLFAILDITPAITDSPNATALEVKGGHIVLNNVSFHYATGKQALNHLSLEVPAGKTVALVGASGSGKSTIMNMVLRFYDPDSGTITIDGTNIKDVTIASLRESIALVSQDIVLFDDTVRTNIAYGKCLNVNDEEIISAAKSAYAHDFIMQLPQGYDTIIGQHGASLSGGQRQRLAIARAILRNSPILLLDEATSALDPISEQQIQAALAQFTQNRTTLVIAHRLSTVINADIIHVVSSGSIIESGTHMELMALEGEYTRLYARQLGATG
jgi:ATP-binding cassette, subfamily B, bacterial MsbA